MPQGAAAGDDAARSSLSMSPAPITIGPFEIQSPLGAGGMGEVWRAEHVVERVPVALKLVTTRRARAPELRGSLRHEVRAMARLDHPGVVMVLDYGDVPAEAEQRSRGRLTAGSPYMVLELMNAGTLKQAPPPRSWEDLRVILLSLLDALAHAHARGVVHRDIKPSNILLHRDPAGGGSRSTRVKLSDFGIAFALEAPGRLDEQPPTAGTPWYMAPEQIVSRWREQGPWTDLYSLGCVVYQLVCGSPPFPGRDKAQVCRAHCFDAVPPLVPRFDVPEALEQWLAIALAKRSTERFETAADAAHALLGLTGTPMRPGVVVEQSPTEPRAAPALEQTTVAMVVEDGLGWMEPPPTAGRGSSAATRPLRSWMGAELAHGTIASWEPPPMPLTWRSDVKERRPSIRLLGVGMGLYGLRPVPLADRQGERDELWATLREVRSSGRPRLVVLEGGPGHGKSRLAEWLTERAGELGAATALRATHSPVPAPSDGIHPMLLRHMRGAGLTGDELRTHVERALSDLDGSSEAGRDAQELGDLLTRNEPSDESGLLRLVPPAERFATVRRYLARLCRRRPLVVVLDDAQWSVDSLAFAEHLMRTGVTAPLPIVLILTVQSDALADLPGGAERLDALCTAAASRRIALGPLAPADQAELVQRLLGLEAGVAAIVEERTAGNPLFAVQLVGDWIQRGRLVAGPEGFRLRPGEQVALPDDVHALWSGRVQRVIDAVAEPRREAAERAMQVAALLGRQLRFDEWRGACAAAGLEPPQELLDLMAVRGLASVETDGWSLVHGMLRDSLDRRAREQGVWKTLHGACASMLAREDRRGDGTVAERLARHLLAADRLEEALEPLLEAANQRLATSDFREAHRLFAMREGALAVLGVPEDTAPWAAGWVRRAETLAVQGELDEAAAFADRAAPIAERLARAEPGDPTLHATVLFLRGAIAQKRGELDGAIPLFKEARRLREALGDELGSGNCLHGIAECEKLRGELTAAAAHYLEACARFRASGSLLWLSRSLTGLADLKRREGDTAAALRCTHQALDYQRQLGNRHALGVTLNGLGDIARHGGDLEEAERRYREAAELMMELGSAETTLVRMNLGLVLVARREHLEARRIFEAARRALSDGGRETYVVYACAGLVPCFAGLADWPRFDATLTEAEHLLAASGLVDDDVAACLEQAGELARGRGESRRARRAYEAALAQWAGLGREDRAQSVRAALA